MNVLSRWLGGEGGRGTLRRVSPEKAKAAAPSRRRATLPQAGEKITIAAVGVVAASLFLGFGAGLSVRGWCGLIGLVTVAVALFQRYLLDFRLDVLRSVGRVLALAVLLVLPLAATRAFEALFGLQYAEFLPLSLVALVIALVWNRRFSLECTAFIGAMLGLYFMLHSERGFEDLSGLAVALSGATVAALSAEHVKRRSTLVKVGVVIGISQMVVQGTFLLMGPPDAFTPITFGHLLLLGVYGLISGLLVSGFLPMIESVFHVTTAISLLELGNTHEQPLLRKLLLEAPGTFHHSYIVGLLSEAAAEEVGADALLARVGALYHDVGKLNKPDYFAENSPEARGRHKDLTPEMSMLIISAHPRDGVELGRYYGLPEAILDFMPEHHGTLVIEYFYHAARKMRGEENVSEDSFRYPGPRPQRIETAIVMMADAVEAISRQMPDSNRARLEEMVHEVAFKRLMQRQFEECAMTLKDLALIEKAFLRVLLAIYHQRKTYPKGNKPNPLDLSQPSAERRAAMEEQKNRGPRTPAGAKA